MFKGDREENGCWKHGGRQEGFSTFPFQRVTEYLVYNIAQIFSSCLTGRLRLQLLLQVGILLVDTTFHLEGKSGILFPTTPIPYLKKNHVHILWRVDTPFVFWITIWKTSHTLHLNFQIKFLVIYSIYFKIEFEKEE